jgi:hypothetical protein
MTLEELLAREAIRHTLASYHMGGDGNDADAYAVPAAPSRRSSSVTTSPPARST